MKCLLYVFPHLNADKASSFGFVFGATRCCWLFGWFVGLTVLICEEDVHEDSLLLNRFRLFLVCSCYDSTINIK
jgi:hypothetical protein